MSSKPYAVVIFDDKTCSEIPTAWLNSDHKKCLWPHNVKNVSYLMGKNVLPDDSWVEYDVVVEAYCSSLNKARKKAEDKDYTTADENSLGRGRRQKSTFHPYQTDSSCESRESSESPPPQLSRHPSFRKKTKSSVAKADLDLPIFIEVPAAEAPTVGVPTVEAPTVEARAMEAMVQPELIVLNDSGLTKKIDKILETALSTNLYIKSINERLKKLELGKMDNKDEQTTMTAEVSHINSLLPIQNLDALNQFENLVLNNEGYAKNVTTILTSIGGKNGKDNLQRLLKKVFTNETAVKCSWLGQRGNFKINNTQIMTTITGVIISSYADMKQHDLEHIASEWFRLAKLRASRENK